MTPKTRSKVRFEPSGVEVEVQPGTIILKAAQNADVFINSICGGDGICGKCKVEVLKGNVESPPTMLLTRQEVRRNYVLACQARIAEGDVVIGIPEESRLGAGQIDVAGGLGVNGLFIKG